MSMNGKFTFLSFLVLVTLWSVVVVEGNNEEMLQDEEVDDDDDVEFTMSRIFLRHRHRNRDLQSSSTSESTHVNILTTLKESIGLTIVGLLLICIAPYVIWKNEQRHVMELSRIEYCKKEATEVQANAPSSEYNERLVHFTGTVQAGDGGEHFGLEFGNNDNNKSKSENDNVVVDKLNVTSPVPKALLLKRTCYIYQKFEDAHQETKKDMVGGGETRTTTYTMREAWTTCPQPLGSLPHLPQETNSRGNWDALVQASGGGIDAAAADEDAAATTEGGLPRNTAEVMGAFGNHNFNASHHPPHGHALSPSAHVGGFALSTEVITLHPHVFATDWIPVPTEYIPHQVEGVESLVLDGKQGNVLTDVAVVSSSDESPNNNAAAAAGQPKNGNVKIVYEYVLDGFDCSFIVKQVAATAEEPDIVVTAGENDGNADMKSSSMPPPPLFGMQKFPDIVDTKCLGCTTDLGDGWMVQKGNHDLEEMIAIAQQEEGTMNKIMRFICWILLLAGWSMLFAPFVTALSVLPLLAQLGGFAVFIVAFILSCLCCNVVTLLAYLRFRPIMSGSLLALALGITGVVIWRLDQAAKTGGDVEE